MYQGVLKKRKTEVERINGAIVELGKKHGLPTPFNEVMLRLVQIMEAAYNYENK
jgi:2-dehydropantoate 2-reductase